MSRLPPPPSVGPGPVEAAPFAPGAYPPPPGVAGVPAAGPTSLGIPPPSFAPKLRVRKTPEMLGYRSVEALGTIVAALFAVWVPFSIYIAKLSMDRQALVEQHGLNIPFELAHPLDTRLQMLDTLNVVLLGVTAVLFLFWFARTYGNLPTISPGKTNSRTSVATVMWILPIVSLLRPFGYLKEIWVRTDRVATRNPKPPVLIVVYWLTFLAGYLLNVAAISVDLRDSATVEDAKLGASLGVMSSISAVLCSALIAFIVWTVTRRMTTRCNEVTTAVLNAPQHA